MCKGRSDPEWHDGGGRWSTGCSTTRATCGDREAISNDVPIDQSERRIFGRDRGASIPLR